MAFRRKPETRPRTRALVASGRKLRLDDQLLMAAYNKRAQAQTWHPKAWMFNREIGEVGFAHDYVRDALARVRIYVGIRPEPDANPVPLDKATFADGSTVDASTIAAADALLERLTPQDEFMGGVAFQLDIAGDCHVALVPHPEDENLEAMYVLSTEAFRAQGDAWQYRLDDGAPWITIDQARSTVFRIWTSDGRFYEASTSPMRRLLGVCEEILLLTREINGTALSRIAMNGILYIDESLTLASAVGADEADTQDAGDGDDPFIAELMKHGTAAITDPESAAVAFPLIIRGHGNPDEVIKHYQIARPFDQTAAAQRTELLGRVANGVNLPREIVLGMGSTNHWNDEQIDEQTWRIHLEARARRILSATTIAYLQPELIAQDVDERLAREIVFWYDPSGFLGDPDLSDDADAGYDRLEISGEAYRRYKGFAEADAPTPQEIAERLARDSAGFGFGAPTPAVDDEEDDDDVPVDEAIAAAGRRRNVGRLGRRLVAIERDARTRIQAAADAAVHRLLERAGMQVRNAAARRPANGGNAAIAAQIRDVPVRLIPSTLGPVTVTALGLAEEQLIDADFAELRTTWHQIVRRAQAAAMDAAAREVQAQFDLADNDEAQLDEDREAGWVLFAAGLAALARAQMFTPSPTTPPVGEFDDTMTVPSGLVRASLDRAGGAMVDTTSTIAPRALPSATPGPGGAPAAGGATAGPTLLELFRAQLGILADSYEWLYGDEPRRTFEPHAALDGVQFSSWDDDILFAELGDFPYVTHYAPGDHPGCRCDFAVLFTQADQEA